MDLSKTKLTKAEWLSIEMPVSDNEKEILTLIHDGANLPLPSFLFNEQLHASS